MGVRGITTHINARAIIGDLQQLQAAVFDQNLEGRGACIHGVLNQLFQRVNRGDDDLAGGDFVDNVLIKRLSNSNLAI